MPRLVYLDSALRDLAGIAEEIETTTRSVDTALTAVARLTRHCERIASLPGLLGRARPELRPDCRSFVSGSHLVFFRYRDESGSRDTLEVIHVVHGARDLRAFFHRRRARP